MYNCKLNKYSFQFAYRLVVLLHKFIIMWCVMYLLFIYAWYMRCIYYYIIIMIIPIILTVNNWKGFRNNGPSVFRLTNLHAMYEIYISLWFNKVCVP